MWEKHIVFLVHLLFWFLHLNVIQFLNSIMKEVDVRVTNLDP